MKHSDQNALLDNYLKKTKVSLVRFISEFHHLLAPTWKGFTIEVFSPFLKELVWKLPYEQKTYCTLSHSTPTSEAATSCLWYITVFA